MKVAVTQGHEQGIGLEVFFKSALFLGHHLQHVQLFASQEAVSRTLDSLRFPFKLLGDAVEVSGAKIPATWMRFPHSFESIERALTYCEQSGSILFTLPTSKDQFPSHPGHTEYFRDRYHNPDLGMFFSSPDLRVLLLTDHTAIKDLPETLTEELMYRRIRLSLKTLLSWGRELPRVLVSGLNPHAGEGGLIGNEDSRIPRVLERLRLEEDLIVSGPFPGDTLLLEKRSPEDVLIYLFHDQGLGVFKGRQGFIGSNITLGMPFPRFSPDHGTSFSLFGKNQADYRGCAFALKEALALRERLAHGKNSSHQSKGSQPKERRR